MNKHFIRAIILFIVAGIYFPIYSQRGDTLFIRRGENEKIRFVHFAENTTSKDRKMSNKIIENEFRK